jgi:hypothetical protein
MATAMATATVTAMAMALATTTATAAATATATATAMASLMAVAEIDALAAGKRWWQRWQLQGGGRRHIQQLTKRGNINSNSNGNGGGGGNDQSTKSGSKRNHGGSLGNGSNGGNDGDGVRNFGGSGRSAKFLPPPPPFLPATHECCHEQQGKFVLMK